MLLGLETHLVERQEDLSKTQIGSTNLNLKPKDVHAQSNELKLLELAKKQGMNTDIRRSVFVVVMSSEVRDDGIQNAYLPTSFRITLMHASD